jgi:DNA-binding Lrp family transcriptional regulator
MLDKIDLKIINLLGMDCRRSCRSMALAVDLTPRSVKSRIDKMISNGIIESFILNVNPAIFGYETICFLIIRNANKKKKYNFRTKPQSSMPEGQEEKEGNYNDYYYYYNNDINDFNNTIINRLNLLGDLLVHVECLGGISVFCLVIKAGMEHKIDNLISQLSHMIIQSTIVNQRLEQASIMKINKSDLKIVKSLLTSPRMEIADIAKEVSMSVKTIRRRLDLMKRNHILEFTILCNPASMGASYIQFGVAIDVERDLYQNVIERIYRELQDYFLCHPPVINYDDVIHLVMCSIDIRTIDSILRKIESYDGVNAAEVFLPTKVMHYQDWILREINKMLIRH